MRIVALLGAWAIVVGHASASRAQTIAPSATGIKHIAVTVASTNDEWTPARINVNAGDIVIVRAPGYVTVGAFVGERDANGFGPNGAGPVINGSLEYKVGVGPGRPAGKSDLHVVDESGELKFRVRDSDYHDNRGEFEVDVVVIPRGAIPPLGRGETTSPAESGRTATATMKPVLRRRAGEEESSSDVGRRTGAIR